VILEQGNLHGEQVARRHGGGAVQRAGRQTGEETEIPHAHQAPTSGDDSGSPANGVEGVMPGVYKNPDLYPPQDSSSRNNAKAVRYLCQLQSQT
jgi:hypothetical protein